MMGIILIESDEARVEKIQLMMNFLLKYKVTFMYILPVIGVYSNKIDKIKL